MKNVKSGINDFKTLYPKLASEWHPTMNGSISPSNINYGSNYKAWWICPKGHSYESTLHNRIKGSSCPYCKNKKALKGYNDFASQNPDLMKEWDYKKNTLDPTAIVSASKNKIWWKCEKGHSWNQSITDRKKSKGCPYCNNVKILSGFNDFATLNPKLLKEWDFEKNTINPTTIGNGSHYKIYWKCDKGHSWFASIHNRIQGNGCPICSNQLIVKGINDFPTEYPFLLKEWDFDKNIDISPFELGYGSQKSVYWKCEKGHSWKARVYQRTQGHGCPICKNELSTSYPEQVVFYYILQVYPDAINRYKCAEKGISEIDIYIPSINVGIEYNGIYYHSNKKRDDFKKEKILSNGIRLICINESNDTGISFDGDNIFIKHHPSNENLSNLIKILFNLLGYVNYIVNVQNDQSKILENFINIEKEKSIGVMFPELISEWDNIKNGTVTPFMIKPGSDRKYWWICSKGHSYLASASNRIFLKRGCPICAGKQILPGFNDLSSNYPILSKEWDYDKNGDLKPNQVSKSSGKKVWWKCSKGHSWQAAISNRIKGIGCPICSNRVIVKGYNDLFTIHPELLLEWDFDKNKNISPYEIGISYREKVWWKCAHGHSWETKIETRHYGSGCPECYKVGKKKTK